MSHKEVEIKKTVVLSENLFKKLWDLKDIRNVGVAPEYKHTISEIIEDIVYDHFYSKRSEV